MTEPDEAADRRLDANAVAGPLAELFTVDLTVAVVTCVGCANSAPLAAHPLYADAPALVVRCPHCAGVVLRYASTGHRLRLDLTGPGCSPSRLRPTDQPKGSRDRPAEGVRPWKNAGCKGNVNPISSWRIRRWTEAYQRRKCTHLLARWIISR